MNWFLHNPIADLPGPYFLGVYAAVIAILLVEAYLKVRRRDDTAELPLPPLPSKLDPHEVAFLRGGASELTRLLVFDLTRRGYLRPEESKKKRNRIEQSPAFPDPMELSPLEQQVFHEFRLPKAPEDLFRPGGLVKRIEAACSAWEESFQEEQLVRSHERVRSALRLGLSSALMILLLGGYKLIVALAKGRHNVAFLLMMGVAGLIALALVCTVPRLTRRGRGYVERLQQAFEGLKEQATAASFGAAPDHALVLSVGLFGMAVLAGTPLSFLPQYFAKSAAGGGCGAGCGSGGCGGGGCGGGCGGCGG